MSRYWRSFAAGLLCIALLALAPANPFAQVDASSREVNVVRFSHELDAVSRVVAFRRSTPQADAMSREVVISRSTNVADAVSRAVFIQLGHSEGDAVTREVVIFRSSGDKDAVTREYSLNVLGDVTVTDGFLAREYARIPVGPVEMMSVAVQSVPVDGYLDLFIAATSAQYGSPGDPADDFLYRIRRHDLRVEEFATLGESDTDPVDIVFGGGGAMGSDLYMAARHYDGFAAGDTGAILRIDDNGNVFPFYTNPTVATAPLGLAVGGAASFSTALIAVNDDGGSESIFSVDPLAVLAAFGVQHSLGFQCVEFAPGNGFGSNLYAGGSDGVIYQVDAAGNVAPFSTPLGGSVQGLAFSGEFGFGEWIYAVLGNGMVLRVDHSGNSEEFLQPLLIQPLANDVVRNDLTFGPSGDILYVTDARRGLVYGVQSELMVPNPDRPSVATRFLGNVPNPFNPNTELRFELKAAGPVDLVVYDVQGRLVRTLARGQVWPAGAQAVTWNGCDDRGAAVSSGVYLAVFRAADAVETHKMTLVK